MDRGPPRAQPTTDRGRSLLSGWRENSGGKDILFLQLDDGRVIPNCFIRLRKVLGGIPKRTAAPSEPSMCQFVRMRVCRMCRRSRSLRPADGDAVKEESCEPKTCSSIRKTGS